MTVPEKQQFTLGFIFDSNLERVLLVHKQRPEAQKGRTNGVGGKFEPGETPEECMRREVREETTLDIPENEWTPVGVMHWGEGDGWIFTTRYTGDPGKAQKGDHEDVEWFGIHNLPKNAMSNLHWLIPLSLEKLDGKFKTFSVEY